MLEDAGDTTEFVFTPQLMSTKQADTKNPPKAESCMIFTVSPRVLETFRAHACLTKSACVPKPSMEVSNPWLEI